MKLIQGPAFLALLQSYVSALESPPAGVLQFDIARRSDLPHLGRRADTVATSLTNNLTGGVYVATVKVGTPSQTLTLQVDTGSSDIWLPASNATICQKGGCYYGSYDFSKSTSAEDVLPGEFKIKYGDKTYSNGDYITDTLSLGGTSVDSVVMGLGTDTDIPYGLVGVGYPGNEAIMQIDPDNEYLNLPYSLAKNKIINTPAYSLWLNDLDASTGSILFGGIDTAQYHGDLTRLNLYPSKKGANVTEFIVALTSVTAVSSSGQDKLGSAEFPMAVLLDSGTSVTRLPEDLATEMYAEVGAVADSSGEYLVPCSFTNSQGYFSFGFGGPNGALINVSMSELVFPGALTKFTSGAYSGQDACFFGILPSTSGTFILGDTFLRSAYVVYDLGNDEVAMAPTNFNTTASNVVAFASAGDTIPSSTPAPSQDSSELVGAAISATPTSYVAKAGFTSVKTSGASPSLYTDGSLTQMLLVTAMTSFSVLGGFLLF